MQSGRQETPCVCKASILNTQRSGTITDEPAAVYCVKTSGENTNRGIHFISKEKINSWVNGEREGTKTSRDVDACRDYSFVHQVFGQFEVVEKILTPQGLSASTGFSKRLAQGYFFEAPLDHQQQAATSKQFLVDMFNWMGKEISENPPPKPNKVPPQFQLDQDEEVEETPRRHYLDEIAESMYRKVQQAVSDWTKENEDKCHPTLACVGPAHVLLLCFHWNQVWWCFDIHPLDVHIPNFSGTHK